MPNNVKVITKQEFLQMSMPSMENNAVVPARMELKPNDIGVINGNRYSIKVLEDNSVQLTKLESVEVFMQKARELPQTREQ